jgi:menaquinol-cytochrome c reductase iron-sulfur subunit
MAADAESTQEGQENEGSRRSFLGLSGLIGGLVALLTAVPVVRLFAAPLTTKRERNWHPLGPTSEFTQMGGEMKEAKLVYNKQDGWYSARREERVLVREDGPDAWTVFSTKCTHFGCGVTWKPDEKIFFCPCHNGEFNADGTVKKAPPERPLDKYAARKNDATGMLEVQEI